MTMISFSCISFYDLSLDQLYRILQLRQEVFAVEQVCPYQDCDDKDQDSYHVLGLDSAGRLLAYTRLVPPGLSYEGYASIGRVVTSQTIRQQGQGTPLMQYSIAKAIEIWPEYDLKISAQTYISHFYEQLGFVSTGDEYLEDDIPHIAMIRQTK